jgi:adenine phosphoribosyltransferase
VDDVVSTGSTVEGMLDVLVTVSTNVVGIAAVFTDGDEPSPDVIDLGHLPLFGAELRAAKESACPAAGACPSF